MVGGGNIEAEPSTHDDDDCIRTYFSAQDPVSTETVTLLHTWIALTVLKFSANKQRDRER